MSGRGRDPIFPRAALPVSGFGTTCNILGAVEGRFPLVRAGNPMAYPLLIGLWLCRQLTEEQNDSSEFARRGRIIGYEIIVRVKVTLPKTSQGFHPR